MSPIGRIGQAGGEIKTGLILSAGLFILVINKIIDIVFTKY